MDKTRKILVTGGTGFIGSYILRDLLQAGFQKIFATHRKESEMSLVDDIVEQIEWVEMDILDVVGLDMIVPEVDMIIHAAALVSFNPADRDQLMKINAEGTANLVNAALEWNVSRFIHISSIATIASGSPRPLVNEDDTRENSKHESYYSISKQKAEMEVWRGGGEGLSIAILNPSVVLGSGFWNKGSASMFRQLEKGVPFYPTGSSGFVDVRDVAAATVKLVNSNIENERIIISGENMTYREMFALISEGLQVKKPRMALNPILRELGLWMFKIRGWFSSDANLVSRSSLRSVSHQVSFDNTKSLDLLGMEYKDIRQTVSETTTQLREAANDGYPPRYLPIE